MNKLAIILLSSLLIVTTVPAQGQSTAPTQGQTQKQTTHKQTTHPAKASKDDIRNAQQALKEKGIYSGPVDGSMNADTQKALRDFQQKNSLSVTGTLDHETMSALGVTHEATPGSIPAKERKRTGKQSSSIYGGKVRESQMALKEAGFNPGPIDGIMGPRTTTAIRNYQSHSGLEVTGTLTPETHNALIGTSTAAARSHQFETTSETPSTYIQNVERDKPTKVDKDVTERVYKASDALRELTTAADKRIPNELLERAEAIAVIPNMIKGAFGIGGRYGKGLVSERLSNGRWSPPAFLEVGGGSLGAQLGISSTDLVLVFTDRNALHKLEGGKDLKLGVDASAVAGPIGRSAEAGVNLKLESAIYAYSRAKGLFVGIALDGAVLNIDERTNEKVYGPNVSATDILDGKAAANSTVKPFLDTLEKVVPKKRIS